MYKLARVIIHCLTLIVSIIIHELYSCIMPCDHTTEVVLVYEQFILVLVWLQLLDIVQCINNQCNCLYIVRVQLMILQSDNTVKPDNKNTCIVTQLVMVPSDPLLSELWVTRYKSNVLHNIITFVVTSNQYNALHPNFFCCNE